MLREIRGREFDDQVLGRDGTSLVLFWATWCRFCQQFKRIFDERSSVTDVDMVSVDISDDSDPLWEAYEVDAVPTLVLFRDGQPVGRKDAIPDVGLTLESIDELLAAA